MNIESASEARAPRRRRNRRKKTRSTAAVPSSDEKLNKSFSKVISGELVTLESMQETLKELGIKDASRNFMKRMVKHSQYFKCCKCECAFDKLNEILDHIKDKGHAYGNIAYRQNRRAFVQRVKDRTGDSTILDVDLDSKQKLSSSEIMAFNALIKRNDLTPGERGTFNNLIYTGICLIRLGELEK